MELKELNAPSDEASNLFCENIPLPNFDWQSIDLQNLDESPFYPFYDDII